MHRRLKPLCLLLIVAACSGDSNLPRATGTLEVAEIDVAPIVAARVQQVLVDEGASVREGEILAYLSQPTTSTEIAGRAANVKAAQATARELQNGSRPAEIQRARADLNAAEAEAKRTADEARRSQTLKNAAVISAQQLEATTTAARVAASRRDAARATLRLLEEGARRERVIAAEAQTEVAQASLSGARAVASDLILRSPINGVVLTRSIEPGEVVNPSQSAITIGDLTRPWVRVYVNQRHIPKIKVNARVTATLDGLPGRKFSGRVVSINREAEYTPRVALTEDERADLMFGVKVEFEDSSGSLKPGLPVTVDFPADGK